MARLVRTILLSFAFLLLLVPAGPASADEFGLNIPADRAGLTKNADVPILVGNIIGAALSLVAVVFFILIVYAGFLWMTAHGKEEQNKKAKDTLIAASIGLLIVLSSYAITTFVFSSLDGRRTTQDRKPAPEQPAPDLDAERARLQECQRLILECTELCIVSRGQEGVARVDAAPFCREACEEQRNLYQECR